MGIIRENINFFSPSGSTPLLPRVTEQRAGTPCRERLVVIVQCLENGSLVEVCGGDFESDAAAVY